MKKTTSMKIIKKPSPDENASLPNPSLMKKFFQVMPAGNGQKKYKLKKWESQGAQEFPEDTLKTILAEVSAKCKKNISILEKKLDRLKSIDTFSLHCSLDLTAFALGLKKSKIITQEKYDSIAEEGCKQLANTCKELLTEKINFFNAEPNDPLDGPLHQYITQTLKQIDIEINKKILEKFFQERKLSIFFALLSNYCIESWSKLSPEDVLFDAGEAGITALAKHILNKKLNIDAQ